MKVNNKYSYAIAEKFLIPHTLQQTYKIIVNEAIHLVNGKYGSVFLYSHGKMIRAYSSNKALYAVLPRKNGITMEVYAKKKVIPRSTSEIVKVLPNSENVYKNYG